MPPSAPVFSNIAGYLFAEPAGWLRVVWHPAARTLADTQALFEHVLLQLQQRNWSRVLIDQTAMTPFNGPEQLWIATQWLPRAVHQGGYRYGAVVLSANVLAQLATAFITTSPAKYPVFCSFATEEAAQRWLEQQPVAP